MPETDQKVLLPKLKPCPCGAPAELQHEVCSQFPDGAGFRVICSRSCAFGSFQKYLFKFQQTAVDNWNLYIEHNF